MMGAVKRSERDWINYGIPLDVDDFRRCYLLLELIPEWRPRLPEVSETFPEWKKLVENWDEMTRLYELEQETGRCPLLWDLMKKLTHDRS